MMVNQILHVAYYKLQKGLQEGAYKSLPFHFFKVEPAAPPPSIVSLVSRSSASSLGIARNKSDEEIGNPEFRGSMIRKPLNPESDC